MGVKKTAILWEYYYEYHGEWCVADCPGKYYWENTDISSVDILYQHSGVGYVKDEYKCTVYMPEN